MARRRLEFEEAKLIVEAAQLRPKLGDGDNFKINGCPTLPKTNLRVHLGINTLAPGLIATDLNRFLWEKDAAGWKQLSKTIPLARTGLPEDQVGAAIFLASDESSWMTGSSITIDGGVDRR